MKNSFYQYSYEDLSRLFLTKGFNTTSVNLLFNQHYKKKNKERCNTDIAKSTIEYIDSNFDFTLPTISEVSQASDKTVKFLFELDDSSRVETVLIPFNGKYSVCLSSQVGCAMNCSFCYTGTQGLTRNLKTDEIVGQFLGAWNWLRENRIENEMISNIVFMGQGEPLHNFDAVKKSCEIFLSQYGTSIGAQKITISTSGFLPGLKRWREEMPKVNLALSLHSPFMAKRSELIPINKKYPLEEVLSYIDSIPLSKKQFVTYEYLLVKDFNDQVEDAQALGKLLKGKEAYINIIPFNPFPGSNYKRPSHQSCIEFKTILDTYKIPTLIRITKGDDVLAACGQLNSN